ncbi:hypothetical protein ACKKBG_A15645 [Auxenochlorella protothecoides x Auxenochlorella symbiontica]
MILKRNTAALVWILAALTICQTAHADCDPGVALFALPTVYYRGEIMLVDNHRKFCQLKGFRDGFYQNNIYLTKDMFPDFNIRVLNLGDGATCDPRQRQCEFVRFVECVPEGAYQCSDDFTWIVGMGTGNAGSWNFGDFNVGDSNIGNRNIGWNNVGSNNTGENIICHNLSGNDRCRLSDLLTGETYFLDAPPYPPPRPPRPFDPPSPSPPSPPLPPPSPPPPGQTCDSGTRFIALPTIEYNGVLYLTSPSSPDAYCRLKGFAGSGSMRILPITLSTPFSKFSISTLDPGTLEMCTPTEATSCQSIAVIECLPEGIPKCTPDASGNIGNGNIGSNNLGHNNNGNNNVGNHNHGSNTTGSENWGDNLVCNNIQDGGQDTCTVTDLRTTDTIVLKVHAPSHTP